MADEPSKTPGTPMEHPAPQIIPLSKIHDLPGVFIAKQPDKSYGGLGSSIQASGVKEPGTYLKQVNMLTGSGCGRTANISLWLDTAAAVGANLPRNRIFRRLSTK